MSTFARRLALISLGGLIIRIAYAVLQRHFPVIGDALTYHVEGGYLAHGEGFRRVFEDVPTAEHPPGMTVVVAALDLVGLDSTAQQKVGLAVLGATIVPLLGLVGRAAAGETVGLIAAGIAAVYPNLWAQDATLMSETVYGVLLALTLLVAHRARDVRGHALLGALIGLGALTRGESLGLIVLLVLPLARRERSWRHGLAGVVACAVVLTPWTVRNLATFDRPVLISTNSDGIWVGANCPDTYYGPLIGSWVFSCYGKTPPGDEAVQSREYRRRGLTYMKDHLGRLPLVVAARAGRLTDLYRPWGQGVYLAGAEGRRPAAQKLGLVAWWLLAPCAIGGAVLLRRRRQLLILGMPVLLVVLVGLTTYGSTRFRYGAEPSVVVLASISIAAAGPRVSALLRRRGDAA